MTQLDIQTAYFTPGPSAPEVWGRSPAERAKRQLARMGVQLEPLSGELPAGPVVLLKGDVIFHQSVLKGLLNTPDVALVDDEGVPLAVTLSRSDAATRKAAIDWLASDGPATPPDGLLRVKTLDIADLYNAKLRRRDDPYATRVQPSNLSTLEKRIFLSTYKGVTDVVTKYCWPVPARIVTGWCVKLGLTPNFVTSVSFVLCLITAWLFAQGDLGLGILLAWPMTFLDTVDGKLARVTLTSSKFGDIFDHGIDLLHPPLWYFCWEVGLNGALRPWFWPIFYTIIGGYIVGRLCEGYFTYRFGFHVHVWRRFDSFFRLILARRNPNMIILTLSWILGRPDIGIWMVAGWTVITVLVHLVQIAQSVVAARNGPLHSWLEQANTSGLSTAR